MLLGRSRITCSLHSIYLFLQLLSLWHVQVPFSQHVLLLCQALLCHNFEEGTRVVTVRDYSIAGFKFVYLAVWLLSASRRQSLWFHSLLSWKLVGQCTNKTRPSFWEGKVPPWVRCLIEEDWLSRHIEWEASQGAVLESWILPLIFKSSWCL